MAGDDTKSVIVTFKRKDKRADKKKDKIEVVRAAIARSVTFLDTSAVTPRRLARPRPGGDRVRCQPIRSPDRRLR